MCLRCQSRGRKCLWAWIRRVYLIHLNASMLLACRFCLRLRRQLTAMWIFDGQWKFTRRNFVEKNEVYDVGLSRVLLLWPWPNPRRQVTTTKFSSWDNIHAWNKRWTLEKTSANSNIPAAHECQRNVLRIQEFYMMWNKIYEHWKFLKFKLDLWTCFLQLWFHCVKFRKSKWIYEFREKEKLKFM